MTHLDFLTDIRNQTREADSPNTVIGNVEIDGIDKYPFGNKIRLKNKNNVVLVFWSPLTAFLGPLLLLSQYKFCIYPFSLCFNSSYLGLGVFEALSATFLHHSSKQSLDGFLLVQSLALIRFGWKSPPKKKVRKTKPDHLLRPKHNPDKKKKSPFLKTSSLKPLLLLLSKKN